MAKPEKLYCPYCGLELEGDHHRQPIQAWDIYSCEYNRSKDERQPVRELEVNAERIKTLTHKRRQLSRQLKELRARGHRVTSAAQHLMLAPT